MDGRMDGWSMMKGQHSLKQEEITKIVFQLGIKLLFEIQPEAAHKRTDNLLLYVCHFYITHHCSTTCLIQAKCQYGQKRHYGTDKRDITFPFFFALADRLTECFRFLSKWTSYQKD